MRENKSMFGWRARIGVIYPASGLADMEYYELCPPGVTVHVTRTSVPNEGEVTLEDMTELAGGEEFDRLARDLATVKPSAIAWMCTSGSFSRGPEWDKQLRETLSEHGSCPATTTSTSLVTAFKALDAGKVSLATPYEPRLTEKLVEYVEGFGIESVNEVSLDITNDWDIGTLGPSELKELVKEADKPESEAVFVSDTGIVLSPIAEKLENDLDKPVFSANMATIWHALRMSGVNEPLDGLGELFKTSLTGGKT